MIPPILLLAVGPARSAGNSSTDPATLSQFQWVFDGSVASSTFDAGTGLPIDRGALPAALGDWSNRGASLGGSDHASSNGRWTTTGFTSGGDDYRAPDNSVTLTGAFTIYFRITRIMNTECDLACDVTDIVNAGIQIAANGLLRVTWGSGQIRTRALTNFTGTKLVRIRRDASNNWTAAATGVADAAMGTTGLGNGSLILNVIGAAGPGGDGVPPSAINPDNQGIYHFCVADESGGALSAGQLAAVENYLSGASL